MREKQALLLVNLGTPDSPALRDVARYLVQFLTDGRVIDLPRWKRELLVRFCIVPARLRSSSKAYRSIWTEEGSPLAVHSRRVCSLLQERLAPSWRVVLAMRYGNPSIASALEELKGIERLVVLPLFPQYASATTGSLKEEAMRHLSSWQTIPELHFIQSFPTQPKMIEAFCTRAKELPLEQYESILFSFHGLPERQLVKAFPDCLSRADCCSRNSLCYRAQCFATAQAIAARLDLDSYRVCFQSRLGKEPWLQPYLSDLLDELAAAGKKRVLLFSPSFVCDCLETTYEIGVEYRERFLGRGGERLDLVEGLNSHPLWIEALCELAAL